MQDLAEAITWLRKQGCFALLHKFGGSAGETLIVTKREVKDEDGLGHFEPTVVYIHPDPEQGWRIMPPLIGGKAIHVGSLADAVEGAIKIIDGWESAMASESQDGGRQLLELCSQEHLLRETP